MDKETKSDSVKIRRIMKVGQYYKRSPLSVESKDDISAVREEVALATKKRKKPTKNMKANKKLETFQTLRYDTGDLIVITKTKQLLSYIMTITDKSPKKFRWSLVGKLQNTAIDALENLFKANAIDPQKNKALRDSCQLEAYAKLKMVGYFSLLAEENGCILKKQFYHISLLVSDAINLLFAWRRNSQ